MLMTILYILISVSSFIFLIYTYFNISSLYTKTAHIPGPLSFPLIGCSYLVFGSSEYVFKQGLKLFEKYTSPIRFPIGSRVYIGTTNPEQIKTILCGNKTSGEINSTFKFLAVLGGKGLVTAENEVWRVHRKLLQPTFTTKTLESFVSIFQRNALLLTEVVEESVGYSEVDLSDNIADAFLCNIFESSLGVSLKEDSKEIENYKNAVHRGCELVVKRAFRVWLYIDKIFNWSQLGRETYKCRNIIHKFSQNVIEERRKCFTNASIENKGNPDKQVNITIDLLLKLTNNESKFTDEEIRDHITTFILAGFDTTSRTINFILLMLASHPNLQDKVYEEIFNIYGDEDPKKNTIKYEDLKHLKYLERVIKETLRLFPVVPLIMRQAAKEFELGGYQIPVGCGLTIFTPSLHRDKNIWPNPLEFDPDRFLPEEASKRHPFAFIPFSSGSKDCIGRVFAMMSMKVFVATFLRKYVVTKDKITPVKDIRLKMDFLLQTVEPITLRLEKRRNK